MAASDDRAERRCPPGGPGTLPVCVRRSFGCVLSRYLLPSFRSCVRRGGATCLRSLRYRYGFFRSIRRRERQNWFQLVRSISRLRCTVQACQCRTVRRCDSVRGVFGFNSNGFIKQKAQKGALVWSVRASCMARGTSCRGANRRNKSNDCRKCVN